MRKPCLVRLILWVKNPALLSNWYCKTFSWNESFRDEAGSWIEIDANGFILAQHSGSDLKARRWPKIQVVVDNVCGFGTMLIQSGIKVGDISRWKHLEWAELNDPEGNTVQICNQ